MSTEYYLELEFDMAIEEAKLDYIDALHSNQPSDEE
jgi:hypothetical protein